jgi:hypothetical protein
MRTHAALLGVLVITVLPGCASIVTGHNESISVQTPACEGSTCTLTNSKGSWYVKTPGSVTVHRAYGDLTITCTKDGYPSATNTVSSSTKGMAFGNILFGGLIGAGVDIGTGAAYDYPVVIANPMDCRGKPTTAQAPGGNEPSIEKTSADAH